MKHFFDHLTKLHYGGNFWFLFVGLLMTLFAIPYTQSLPGIGRYSMTLLFSLFMLVSVWSLVSNRRIFQIGAGLMLAISGVTGIRFFAGVNPILETVEILLMLIFCGLSCFIAARHVFVIRQVDLNSMLGAFCVYLLLGLIWALLFSLLHQYGYAEFSGNVHGSGREAFPNLVYFSFVSLASLGYGDITPIGGLAKTLAYLEAVVGQFYLAVLVASLVGVYSSGRRHGQ